MSNRKISNSSKVLSFLTCNIAGKDGSPDGSAYDDEFEKRLQEVKNHEWQHARSVHESLLRKKNHNFLGHGPIDDFHKGLTAFLGPPKKLIFEAMEREHCHSADSHAQFYTSNYGITTSSNIEWMFVLDPSARNLTKLGLDEWPKETKTLKPNLQRKPVAIDFFEDQLAEINDSLQNSGLPSITLMEIIALRLYSGPMGVKYNTLIRRHICGRRKGQEWRVEEEQKLSMGNKYPTTIHMIQSAISKLGKISTVQKGFTGLSGLLLPERFWKDHPYLKTKGGVEGGFTSLTSKKEVAMHYATLSKGKMGTLFEVDMSTVDRGAEIKWLSQYPHEDETLLPPLTFLHVDHIRVDESKEDPLLIIYVRARTNQSIQIQHPLLSDAENKLIRQVIKGGNIETEIIVSNSKLLSRFSDEENYLITGNPMESVLGLPYFLGTDERKIQTTRINGIKALEKEILAGNEQEVIRNMKYVLYEKASEKDFSNGRRDLNNTGKRLNDFVKHPMAIKYRLREEHIAALRIYTTSAFRYINNPLRQSRNNLAEKNEKVHPYPLTVCLIDEAIKKLRASTAASYKEESSAVNESEGIYLWRGIKNTRITEDFLHGRRGVSIECRTHDFILHKSD